MAYIDNPAIRLDWAKSFNRTSAEPLDRSSIFASYADALAYAKQDGTDSRQIGKTSYVGQVVVVYGPGSDGSTEEVSAYIITAVGAGATLVKLASSTASGDLAADVAALQGKVGQLESKDGELEGKITANTSAIGTNTSAISDIRSQLTALSTGAMHYQGVSTTNPAEGEVTIDSKPEYSPTAGDVVIFGEKEFIYDGSEWAEFGDTGSYLTSSAAAETYATKESVTTEVERATAAEEALSGRVDAIEGAGYVTKTAADAAYVAKEEGKGLIETTLVDKLNGLANIKTTSADFTVSGEGQLQLNPIDKSKVNGLEGDLSGINTKITALEGKVGTAEDEANAEGTLYARIEKLKADLAGVQANAGKIDTIKVNNVALEIGEDKSVNIPMATAAVLGVVKGAAETNKVAIEADGTMSVNEISTDKLVQGSNELILDGGAAA